MPISNELFAGIAVAFLTGITFIAYKHPDGYARIFKVLIAFFLGFALAANAWNLALKMSFDAVTAYLQPDKVENSKAAILNLGLDNIPFWIGFIVLEVYLLFLSWLPNILGLERSK